MTHKEYQIQQGVTQRAAAYRLKFVGLEFSQHQELSDQQLAQLNERFAKGRKVMQRSSPRATKTDNSKNHVFLGDNDVWRKERQLAAINSYVGSTIANLQSFERTKKDDHSVGTNEMVQPEKRKRLPARQLLLDVINAVELVFFAYGMVKLFGAAGIIPALIPIAFYLFTILDLKQGGQSYRSDVGLFVCALLALGFMWVHGQTFNAWLPGQFYINLSFAGAVSVISWLALVQSIKQDEE
jgi:hypothetical protein